MRRVHWAWLFWAGVVVAACTDFPLSFSPENILGRPGADKPAWQVMQPDNTVANWRAVWAPNHTTAYIVGDNGAIMKWNGDSWRRLSSGTTEDLEAIFGQSETVIWVVGQNGVVLRGDGETFAPVTQPGDGGMVNPTDRHLFTVFGDPGIVFMAGERGEVLTADSDGGLRRMVAETTLRTFPVCESRGVDVTANAGATCVPLVAHPGASGGPVTYGPDTYPTCGAPPECCAFADVPNPNQYCCYPQRCDPDGGPLVGRVGVGADLKAGWYGGGFGVLCGAGGAIYEWKDDVDGLKWYVNELAPNTPYTRDALVAAWGTGPGNVYCAGQDGRLMRRQNGVWSSTSIPTPVYVQGIWGTSSRDIYAVGFSGVLLRLDGFGTHRDAGWYDESVEVPGHLRSVTGVRLDYDGGEPGPDGGPPPARIFVVGSGGKVLIKN